MKISHDARGRGKLVIFFQSHEEFERLRQQRVPAGAARAGRRLGELPSRRREPLG